MDLNDFKESLRANDPPRQLAPLLRAMWYEAKGDWHQAHEIAQTHEDAAAAWVHAYLHRKEGDAPNARYWYRRAGRPFATDAAAESEWEVIVAELLR